MRKIAIVGACLLFVLVAFSSSVFAQSTFREDEVSRLESDETVNGDYFAAGEKVVVSGTVRGDAYIAGGNIRIDGNIDGDLLVAGGDIEIAGRVGGDVRAAGGDVTVLGDVGKNLTLLAGSGEVLPGAKLGGNVVALGGDVLVETPVPGSLTSAAGGLTVADSVGNGINAFVGELNLTSKASVAGDLTYWSEEQADISKEATISGKVIQNKPEKKVDTQQAEKFFAGIKIGFDIFFLLSALLVGLAFAGLLPNFVRRISNMVLGRPWASLGFGFLALIVMPIAAVILMVTVIGLPVGLLTLVGYMALLWLSKVFVSFAVGRRILDLMGRKGAGLVLSLVLGLVVLGVLDWVPIVGGLVGFVLMLMGMGGYLLTKREMYIELREKKII